MNGNARIELTRITNAATDSRTGSPLPLTKTFTLAEDGTLRSVTAAHLTHGRVKRVSVASASELAGLLQTLGAHEALTYGLTASIQAEIVTKAQLSRFAGKIARDREHFRFAPVPSVLFIDYDFHPEGESATPYSPEQGRELLIKVCPALSQAPMVAVASTSSYIYRGTEELRGASGWHLYILVRDGSDIRRAGEMLYERLWLNDLGRYDVSSAGTLLDRTLVDSAVWQPERLDFAAAHCIPPLVQRKPKPQVWNAEAPPFDTRLILAPTAEESHLIAQKRTEAKERVEPNRQRVREDWVAARKRDLIARGVDPAVAQRTALNAADAGALLSDFEIELEDGHKVTIGHILANRREFNGRRCCDPLEPEYRGDKRVAILQLMGGRPSIFSHAHGGQRFGLYQPARPLQLMGGELPNNVDKVLKVIREVGDVFSQPVGSGKYRLVYVNEGHMVEVTAAWLRLYIGRLFRCERLDKRTHTSFPVDVPKDLAEAVLAGSGHLGLPVLEAIVRDPIMRRDGSILDEPGYSERDHLLYEPLDTDVPRIPSDPTDKELRAAFDTLWHPFRDFPFVDAYARGAMVAALLTSAIRPVLDTAPATLFEAPSAGTGKTLLAKCIAVLVGEIPFLEPPPPSDEEAGKRLHAVLREGRRVLIIDNWTSPVYGRSSLCAFLTAPYFSHRVLKESKMEAYPNRTTLLLTGNNVPIYGDAARRIVTCRIDAGREAPSLRTFKLEPERYVKENRRAMHSAALTLLRGFQVRGAKKQTSDTAGSFEQWDAMVRQCVMWLGKRKSIGVDLDDPYFSAMESIDHDPEADSVLSFMRACRNEFGDAWVRPGDVLGRIFCEPLVQAIAALSERGGITAKGLGHWLQKHRDEVVGGLCIRARRDSTSKNYVYTVESLVPEPVRVGELEVPVVPDPEEELRLLRERYRDSPVGHLV